MQPYFLPYIGYFSLISHSDLWVVFDSAQFMKGGWIERNRVLHPIDGWCYIKVPLVKHPISTRILDVNIRSHEPWRERLFAQLVHYKKLAPYYANVTAFLKDAFDANITGIAALNLHLLVRCCHYIGIPFNYTLFSASPVSAMAVSDADEWGLQTAKAFGASEYINAPGGITFYDSSKYEHAGISLSFLKPRLNRYNQHRVDFVSGLSIIDIMMFNEPSTIRTLLDDVELIRGEITTRDIK